ncbi:MAG: flavodoxin family protein [Candidatus Stahlbacteria bacterium]|nr:flavodoxin family protein [Candidatus Stahlbacteria bacterium]
MKVLALVGSPRREGNTAVLVQKVLEGIKSKDNKAEIELLFLNDLQIRPCQSCYSCLSSGICVQEDDMRLIYKSLATANILVVGTPIYMEYVSAQTKLFIDRLFSSAHEQRSSFQSGMRIVLVFTWGWDKIDGYDDVIDEVKGILTSGDRKVVGVVKGVGLRYRKTEALDLPELLKEAFEVGKKVA